MLSVIKLTFLEMLEKEDIYEKGLLNFKYFFMLKVTSLTFLDMLEKVDN